MTEESDMPMTLQRLILDHKGDRSYASLSRSCNGDPTDKRLQQIVANGIKAFPAPRTISNLAMGLGVSVTDVLLASARSLGLNVSGRHFGAALVLPGVEVLDSPERQILLDMARALSITARARWQSQAFDVITELSSRGLKVTNVELFEDRVRCTFDGRTAVFRPEGLSRRLHVHIGSDDGYPEVTVKPSDPTTQTATAVESCLNYQPKEQDDADNTAPNDQAGGSPAHNMPTKRQGGRVSKSVRRTPAKGPATAGRSRDDRGLDQP